MCFTRLRDANTSQGPWTFSEFFGVLKKKAKARSKKPATVKADAIVPLMLLHHENFSDSCGGLAFVTNAGLDPVLSEFLEAIRRAESEAALPEEAQIAFQHIRPCILRHGS